MLLVLFLIYISLYLPLAAVAVEGAPVVPGVGDGGSEETLLVQLQASTVTTTSGSSNNTRGESIVGTAENRMVTLYPGICI